MLKCEVLYKLHSVFPEHRFEISELNDLWIDDKRVISAWKHLDDVALQYLGNGEEGAIQQLIDSVEIELKRRKEEM